MCGRYTLKTPATILQEVFGLPELPAIAPRYNIAPTQLVPVVCQGGDERDLREMRWGLVPYWAKDAGVGNRMINARAESVAERPAYREPFRNRRCLVPADGFYEWQKLASGARQPWYLTLADGRPFAFAGLWDRWRDRATGAVVESCALVTTQPNALVRPIHDRMPVLLEASDFDAWLDAEAERDALEALLLPFPAEAMRARPVSARVSNPAHDDPACLEPVAPAPVPRTLFD